MNRTRLVLAIAWVGMASLVYGQQSTTIDLTNVQFRNATNQSRSSAPGTISPAFLYKYDINAMAKGVGGALGLLFPNPVPLATILENLAPGSSALLHGAGPNATGTHPVTFADQRIDGTTVFSGINVTYGFNIKIEINATNNATFSFTNVVLQPYFLIGYLLITSGNTTINRGQGVVSGIITLGNYTGDVTAPPMTIEFKDPIGGSVLETQPTVLLSNGRWVAITNLRGTYDIAIKGSHWLRHIFHGVAITNDQSVGLDATLTNGDVDGDNEVTLADYGLLSTAFGSVIGDTNWNANADLDGDGEVTLSDYSTLATHFGQAGDE